MSSTFPHLAGTETLSFYGTPGIVDMPSARMLEDGTLALTTSYAGKSLRNTLTFQFAPWASGSFRYSILDDFGGAGGGNLYDRSFDLHVQLIKETPNRPSLAFGLRDIVGTGVYSGEYLVASKSFGNQVTVSGGLGWGRLGSRNGFQNPLGIIDDRFETRPRPNQGGVGGEPNIDNWFRGDAAVFGGLVWNVNDQLSLKAEYSSDAYTRETAAGMLSADSPFNFGLDYRFKNGARIGGYYLYGSEVGVVLSYALDPAKPAVPGGLDSAPPALLPVDRVAAASWNLPGARQAKSQTQDVLQARLASEGLKLESLAVKGGAATVRVDNERYGAVPQAAGRTARVLANTLPPEVSEFNVVLTRDGLPISTVTTRRADLYALEADIDGSWRTFARAEISDAAGFGTGATIGGAYPSAGYRLGPYATFSYFDPDSPLRADAGLELRSHYAPAPGLIFSGQFRYPLVGNIDSATRRSNSQIQRVRSDAVLYARESDLEINHLTGEYFFRPGADLFGRVTAGYLENMYGGISTELLWYPVDSRLALGAEINYARQRDFDMLLGFQDYDVVTGHASAYYDFGGGYLGQLDVGRYLAGDVGATFALDREFNNGFRVGAFFTLTDVSSQEFGEGSFDKGIRLEIPTSWLTGRPSPGVLAQTIRPVYRDGGARLNVRNRLFEYTRDYRAQEMSDEWARYLR